MKKFFHSVTLDKDKCKGCTNCIKRCPTEAIRVQNGKAKILSDRCIDCGECIRVCPHHAKQATYDKLDVLDRFTYTIALPAPSLYSQFNHLENIDTVLNLSLIHIYTGSFCKRHLKRTGNMGRKATVIRPDYSNALVLLTDRNTTAAQNAL